VEGAAVDERSGVPQGGRGGSSARRGGHDAGGAPLDPEKDAKGDQIRLNTLQVSPVQLGAERGYDAEQVVNETIAHNKAAIIKAITARDDIETATSETVPWQMLLRLTAGETDVPDAWAGEAQGDELDEQPPPDGGGQPGDRFAEVGANGVHP
jgi:hypothetical protein